MPLFHRLRHFGHNQILCRLGFHDEREDPDIGWTCRWCRADGIGHGR